LIVSYRPRRKFPICNVHRKSCIYVPHLRFDPRNARKQGRPQDSVTLRVCLWVLKQSAHTNVTHTHGPSSINMLAKPWHQCALQKFVPNRLVKVLTQLVTLRTTFQNFHLSVCLPLARSGSHDSNYCGNMLTCSRKPPCSICIKPTHDDLYNWYIRVQSGPSIPGVPKFHRFCLHLEHCGTC
jgi:hypothetical protein